MTPSIPLDDVFELDAWRLDDAVAHRRFAEDPDAAKWFGWTVRKARALPDGHYEDVVHRFRREWDEGTRHSLAIRWRSDGEPVGWVELRCAGSDADVSYYVEPELRGQGLTPRALEALLIWAVRELGLRRARIGCHVENRASRRVAEKCGFAPAGSSGSELQFSRDFTDDAGTLEA